jgi:hypothetical protein
MKPIGTNATKLALEGLVVVMSILIAFVLDAWWDGRQLHGEMRQELGSVAREVAENRAAVEFEIGALQRIIGGSEAMVSSLEAAPAGRPVAVPDTLAWFVAFWSPSLDLSFGALDALVASGRLAQIEDADLRLGLAGLKGKVLDAVADELLAQEVFERIYTLLSDHVDFAGIYRIDKQYFAQPRSPNRQVPTENATLLVPNTLPVRNAILDRASWLGSALSELGPLLVQLDSLDALMQNSIR